MKKIIFNLSTVGLLTALLFMTASCEEKDYFNPNYKDPTVSETPMTFDFSTTQDVKVNFDIADLPEGFSHKFELYSENPMELTNGQWKKREGVTPIAAGINVAKISDIRRTIPAYVKEVWAYSLNQFVPQLMYAEVGGEDLNLQAVDLSVAYSGDTETRTIGNNRIDRYLTTTGSVAGSNNTATDVNSSHKPNYIDKTMAIPAKYLERITSTFQPKKAAPSQYFEDALLYLHEEAEIWVSVIHSDGSYNSALSYFFYTGTPEELATADKTKIPDILAFPKAKIGTKNNELKAGQYVKLKYMTGNNYATANDKFPAGTTIGFVLRSNAYNEDNKRVNRNPTEGTYYSYNDWNPENGTTVPKQHTIYFNAGDENGDPFICFGFEDMNNSKGDKDCDDVMFNVQISPIDAIDPPEILPEPGFQITNEEKVGILAFEDNWPARGDYDMNDVVVQYNSKITYEREFENLDGKFQGWTSEVYVKEIEDKFTLIHNGGQFYNVFQLHVPIDPNRIESVTLKQGNGTETACELIPLYYGQTGFKIDMTSYVKDILTFNKYYTDVELTNMLKNQFTLKMKFKIPEDPAARFLQTEFNNNKLFAPYNPFITPSPHKQVHLPNYPPAIDEHIVSDGWQLFSVNADRSNVDRDNFETAWGNATLWYVSGNNNKAPFAIHLSNITYSGFKIPAEYEPIDKVYPEFDEWVNSGGTSGTGWYLRNNP
ncbi:LruC domain-containing protein [Bacteroides sp. 214]|uniref:LruC domain-containing protein n=1 Tax=Bacteroides sp. 214 TaxID=2302935 RepID=UPI0013D32F40|nr:LruC domain-containing protein [Bacteroides sp. 214]NDW13220.1 LruC domain-containing protein [Bacteroides sp. 214]